MGKATANKTWGSAQEISLEEFAKEIPKTELTLEQIQWDDAEGAQKLALKDVGNLFITEELESFIGALPLTEGEGPNVAAKTDETAMGSHVIKACGRAVVTSPMAFRHFYAQKDGKAKGVLALMWPESFKAYSYEDDGVEAKDAATKNGAAKSETTPKSVAQTNKNVDHRHAARA